MNEMPKLTLPGEEVEEAKVEAAVPAAKPAVQEAKSIDEIFGSAMTEAPKAPDMAQAAIPTLVLKEEPAAAKVPAVHEPSERDIPMVKFSAEETKVIAEFAKRIDICDSAMVMGYGAAAQQKIGSFTDTALDKVRNTDLGEVGGLMSNLVVQLKGFTDEEDKGGFLGLFKKARSKAELMKSRYEAVSVNVDNISTALTGHQMQLMKDIAMYDQLYQVNLEYYKELSMYIEAGRMKLRETREKDVVALKKKAEESGLMEDAQAANDLVNMCGRFEKKLFDLDLTRNVSLQMAPQIRLLQNNDQMMAEKIQSSLVNTIPLWKNQMVLALGLEHSTQAMEAQRAVTDMTNTLLKKNADTLKQASIDVARESERGIVDIETLKYTNESLISTLDEVLTIQQEGAEKRLAAEHELRQIESELKSKLLSMRG